MLLGCCAPAPEDADNTAQKPIIPKDTAMTANPSSSSQRPVMLITGGSRGIGAATAVLAGRAGYAVAINYRDNVQAAEATASAVEAAGGEAWCIQADVASEDSIMAMFAALDARFGRLDVLVNNAGIVDRKARVQDMSGERLQRMFMVNTVSAFICAREAVKRMSTELGKEGGAIVNVSSAASRLGSANQYVDYAASKGAIDVLTLGLAQEVAGAGIRVNAVRPGLIDTDIHASGGIPNRVNDLGPSVPMGRGGSPEEVAEAIMWLASDKASYTTMSLVDVSGGR
jgi:NAD(P)-dependent dehydrogenase (short-subunit alcohol dehydrogenase family)